MTHATVNNTLQASISDEKTHDYHCDIRKFFESLHKAKSTLSLHRLFIENQKKLDLFIETHRIEIFEILFWLNH